jgi:hypothetical protein
MKVEMVILAFPGRRSETYDTNDEGINEIEIEEDKVRIDFVDQGRNWAREIPISKLQFVEYPTEPVKGKIKEEDIYKGQEGGNLK